MPKLPHISGKECVGILERMGFAQVRQKGSHVIMRRESVVVSFLCIAKSRLEPWRDCFGKLGLNLTILSRCVTVKFYN